MNFLTSLLLLTPALAVPAPQDPVPMPSPVPTPTSSTPSSSASSAPTSSASGDLNCSQKSMAFEGWDLTSFSLTNTTRRPSPSTGPISESELRFTVESSVLGYNVECRAMVEDGAGGNGGGAGNGTATATASGTKGLLGLIQAAGAGDGAFDGAHEFRCEPPADVEQDGTVLFSFDAGSGELYMKQKWVCHEDPMWPAYYTGTGNATAELDCTEGKDEINEDWEIDGDEDYATRTTECVAEQVSAELEQIEAIA